MPKLLLIHQVKQRSSSETRTKRLQTNSRVDPGFIPAPNSNEANAANFWSWCGTNNPPRLTWAKSSTMHSAETMTTTIKNTPSPSPIITTTTSFFQTLPLLRLSIILSSSPLSSSLLLQSGGISSGITYCINSVCPVVDVCESKGGGSAGNNQCIVLVHRGSL